MTPRTQTGNVLCNIPAAVKLMSLKNAPYDIIVDEVDGADYRYEAARLKSFNNWPVKYIKAEKLATAGYFYTGELDIVKCFSCGTETYKWMEGDDPMVDHKRQSPMCKFVRNIPCGNVPTDVVSDVSIAPPESRDVCGPYDLPPDCRRSYSTDSSAKYPEYNFYEARLRTFECWPTFFKQNPEQLALAGFYYTGIGDQVLCFCCGVGVKDWEPDDDPWEQHAIWYPNCNHLHKVKGTKYVREITGRSVSSGDVSTFSCIYVWRAFFPLLLFTIQCPVAADGTLCLEGGRIKDGKCEREGSGTELPR